MKKKLNFDFFVAFCFRGSGVVIVFVLNILLARIYGPDLSGYFYIFYSFLALVHSIVFLGFSYVIVHKVTPYFTNDSMDRSIGNTLISLTIYVLLLTSTIAMMIMFFGADWLAFYLCKNVEYRTVVKITALSIVPYTYIFMLAEIFKTLKKPNWSILCTNVVSNLLFIVLILSGVKDINYIMTMFAVSNWITVAVMIFWGRSIFHEANIRIYSVKHTVINIKGNKAIYTEYLHENLALAVVGISNVILNVFDTIIIGNMLSSSDVSLYNVANKVVSVGSIILTTVNTVIGYKIAEASHRNDKHELQKILKRYTRMMFPLGFIYYLFAIVFSMLIPFVFGIEYQPSVNIAMFLAVGQVVSIITGPCSYFLIMTGQIKTYQKITIYTALITVVMNLVLVRLLGIYGSVLANILALTNKNLFAFIMAKQYVSMKISDFFVREDE